jgi:hypothetical protein
MQESCEPIGRIVRLQVQTSKLKQGERPGSWYDPGPIAVVPELLLDEHGVRGVADDGSILDDVHNETHADSRFRGENGISIGFTGHYQAMRDRFGDHLTDGIAGENILVECDDVRQLESLGGSLVAETSAGQVELGAIEVAAPCVEFGKFCVAYPAERVADQTVTEALKFLHNGMRGFYLTVIGSGTLRVGDAVYRIHS